VLVHTDCLSTLLFRQRASRGRFLPVFKRSELETGTHTRFSKKRDSTFIDERPGRADVGFRFRNMFLRRDTIIVIRATSVDHYTDVVRIRVFQYAAALESCEIATRLCPVVSDPLGRRSPRLSPHERCTRCPRLRLSAIYSSAVNENP